MALSEVLPWPLRWGGGGRVPNKKKTTGSSRSLLVKRAPSLSEKEAARESDLGRLRFAGSERAGVDILNCSGMEAPKRN